MKGLEKVSEKVRSKQGGRKDNRDRGRNDTHRGQGGRVQQLGVWKELGGPNVGDVLDELWQNWRRASWPVPGGQAGGKTRHTGPTVGYTRWVGGRGVKTCRGEEDEVQAGQPGRAGTGRPDHETRRGG